MDEDLMSAAGDAVVRGDLATLLSLLEQEPGLVAARLGAGSTLVQVAAMAVTSDLAIPAVPTPEGTLECVDALLAAGVDPDALDDSGWAALHCAAFAGHVELCRRLVAGGASTTLEAWETPGATGMSFALFYGHVEAAEELASAGVAPDDLRGRAALGHVGELDRFLAASGGLVTGADAGMAFCRPGPFWPERAETWTDQTVLDEALTWSARNGRIESMEWLVGAGADLDANPYRGTALLWAAYGDRVEAARWLLERGADPDWRHDFGGADHGVGATAMHLAAQYESLGVLGVLLDAGADASIRDAAHEATPLEWAEHVGSVRAAALLTAKGGARG